MAAHELTAVAFERGRHRVDMVRAREQDDGRRALGHVGADLVEKRVVELGDAGLRHAPGDPAAHDPDRQSGRPEEHAGHRAGERTLCGSLPDRVALVEDIDVAPGERPANDHPVATVVLHERDLVDPRNVAHGLEHVGVGMVGAFDVPEHGKGEIEGHDARSNRPPPRRHHPIRATLLTGVRDPSGRTTNSVSRPVDSRVSTTRRPPSRKWPAISA